MGTIKYGIWGAVPVDLLREEGLTDNALRVYIALASFQGGADKCWPTVIQIAERSGVARSSVSAATTRLVELGWIAKTRHKNTASTYTLLIKGSEEKIEEIMKSETPGNPEESDSGNPSASDDGNPRTSDTKRTLEKNIEKNITPAARQKALADGVYEAMKADENRSSEFTRADYLACARMAKKAEAEHPEDPGAFLAAMIATFKMMKRGDAFVARFPWTPCTLSSQFLWTRLCDELAKRTRKGDYRAREI